VLTKFGLAEHYAGQEEPDGEDYNVDPVEDGPRPFSCLLDAGLKRTSTGSKTFAALKVRASACLVCVCLAGGCACVDVCVHAHAGVRACVRACARARVCVSVLT
jgi:hypothetical protein